MTELMVYSAACAAVLQAKTVDDAREIADKAEAMRVYASRAKNRDLEMDAAEIRIRAERRLGELLIELKSAGNFNQGSRFEGRVRCQVGRPRFSDQRPTLAQVGIDRKLSMRAQVLARISSSPFEAQLARLRSEFISGNISGRAIRIGAAACPDQASPFDHQIAGRRAGSIRAGELTALAARLEGEARVLRVLARHCRCGRFPRPRRANG